MNTRVSAKRRAEAEPLYREGGEAIGRLLCRHPEKEAEIWALVAGTGIWKRWHLKAFKAIWRLENPREYSRITSGRHNGRKSSKKRAAKLEASREAATAAMLKPTQPSERPEEPQP